MKHRRYRRNPSKWDPFPPPEGSRYFVETEGPNNRFFVIGPDGTHYRLVQHSPSILVERYTGPIEENVKKVFPSLAKKRLIREISATDIPLVAIQIAAETAQYYREDEDENITASGQYAHLDIETPLDMSDDPDFEAEFGPQTVAQEYAYGIVMKLGSRTTPYTVKILGISRPIPEGPMQQKVYDVSGQPVTDPHKIMLGADYFVYPDIFRARKRHLAEIRAGTAWWEKEQIFKRKWKHHPWRELDAFAELVKSEAKRQKRRPPERPFEPPPFRRNPHMIHNRKRFRRNPNGPGNGDVPPYEPFKKHQGGVFGEKQTLMFQLMVALRGLKLEVKFPGMQVTRHTSASNFIKKMFPFIKGRSKKKILQQFEPFVEQVMSGKIPHPNYPEQPGEWVKREQQAQQEKSMWQERSLGELLPQEAIDKLSRVLKELTKRRDARQPVNFHETVLRLLTPYADYLSQRGVDLKFFVYSLENKFNQGHFGNNPYHRNPTEEPAAPQSIWQNLMAAFKRWKYFTEQGQERAAADAAVNVKTALVQLEGEPIPSRYQRLYDFIHRMFTSGTYLNNPEGTEAHGRGSIYYVHAQGASRGPFTLAEAQRIRNDFKRRGEHVHIERRRPEEEGRTIRLDENPASDNPWFITGKGGRVVKATPYDTQEEADRAARDLWHQRYGRRKGLPRFKGHIVPVPKSRYTYSESVEFGDHISPDGTVSPGPFSGNPYGSQRDRLRLREMQDYDLQHGESDVRLLEMLVDSGSMDQRLSMQFWRDVDTYGVREAFIYLKGYADQGYWKGDLQKVKDQVNKLLRRHGRTKQFLQNRYRHNPWLIAGPQVQISPDAPPMGGVQRPQAIEAKGEVIKDAPRIASSPSGGEEEVEAEAEVKVTKKGKLRKEYTITPAERERRRRMALRQKRGRYGKFRNNPHHNPYYIYDPRGTVKGPFDSPAEAMEERHATSPEAYIGYVDPELPGSEYPQRMWLPRGRGKRRQMDENPWAYRVWDKDYQRWMKKRDAATGRFQDVGYFKTPERAQDYIEHRLSRGHATRKEIEDYSREYYGVKPYWIDSSEWKKKDIWERHPFHTNPAKYDLPRDFVKVHEARMGGKKMTTYFKYDPEEALICLRAFETTPQGKKGVEMAVMGYEGDAAQILRAVKRKGAPYVLKVLSKSRWLHSKRKFEQPVGETPTVSPPMTAPPESMAMIPSPAIQLPYTPTAEPKRELIRAEAEIIERPSTPLPPVPTYEARPTEGEEAFLMPLSGEEWSKHPWLNHAYSMIQQVEHETAERDFPQAMKATGTIFKLLSDARRVGDPRLTEAIKALYDRAKYMLEATWPGKVKRMPEN